MTNKVMSPKYTNPKDKPSQTLQNYVLEDTIGEGTFGLVKIATHIPSGEKVAIKILEKNKIKDKSLGERVTREINFLKKLRHKNIIQLYEIIEQEDCIYLIMEYAKKGEFFNYIVDNTRLNEDEASLFYVQIINALEYIHENKISHRDLKPENLLLTENKILKCIDFGLSNNFKEGNSLSTPCGSPCYAAPEMLLGKKYNGTRIDIWSTGIILYAMVCGYLPFEDEINTELYKKILECKLEFLIPLSKDCLDLIKRLLNTNPEKRINIIEIKRHKFYKMGEKNLKKLNFNYEEKKISEEALKMMTNLGYKIEEVKSDINNKLFNNCTATYYLIVNKIKYEKFLRNDQGEKNDDDNKKNEIMVKLPENLDTKNYNTAQNNFEYGFTDSNEENDEKFIFKETFENFNPGEIISPLSEINTQNNVHSVDYDHDLIKFERISQPEFLKSENSKENSLSPRSKQFSSVNQNKTVFKSSNYSKTQQANKKPDSARFNTNIGSSKVIKVSNYLIQNSNFNININQNKNYYRESSQEKQFRPINSTRNPLNNSKIKLTNINRKQIDGRYLRTEYSKELKQDLSKRSNSHNKSYESIKLNNGLQRKLHSNSKINDKKSFRGNETALETSCNKYQKENVKKIQPTKKINKFLKNPMQLENSNNLRTSLNKFSKNENSKSKVKEYKSFNRSKVENTKLIGTKFESSKNLKVQHPVTVKKPSIDSKGFSNLVNKTKQNSFNNSFQTNEKFKKIENVGRKAKKNSSIEKLKEKIQNLCKVNKFEVKKKSENKYELKKDENIFSIEFSEAYDNKYKFSHEAGQEKTTKYLIKNFMHAIES